MDILLTHAPPRGVGDGPDPPHQGFPIFNALTRWLRPALLLHGHVDPEPAAGDWTVAGRHHRAQRNGWQLMLIEPVTGLVERQKGTAMPADTGFPRADVENDFLRARRRQVLARLVQRLRREPDDVNLILPFDDVVAALGRTGERRLGLQTIRLDHIVGTVDSRRDFDRRFRPTSNRVRERWERLALAQRRGESIPPIDVYQVGGLYFVKDGHHRVSIALATGQKVIDAYVTEVLTAVPAKGIRRRGDLLFKSYEQLFRSRVKLPPEAYTKIKVSDPWSYAELSEAVEAWASGSCSTRPVRRPRRGVPPLVHRGVRPGRAHAASRRPDRQQHRGRGLPHRRQRALPADPDARME